jgi:hypothetical protein
MTAFGTAEPATRTHSLASASTDSTLGRALGSSVARVAGAEFFARKWWPGKGLPADQGIFVAMKRKFGIRLGPREGAAAAFFATAVAL